MCALKNETVTPLYQQVYAQIRGMIERGDYSPGQKIPSENYLTKKYGVSRVTVRSALKKLADEKFLTKCHGKGTFVALTPRVESFAAGGSFTASCLQLKLTPQTVVLSCEYEVASASVARGLKIEQGSKVTCIKRLRKVEGIPVIYEVDYFPGKFDFKRENDNVSLLDIVRRDSGALDIRFDDTIDIAYADDKQSEALDCSVCAPLLHVFERVKCQNDKILYCNHQYIVSERYKLAIRRKAL